MSTSEFTVLRTTRTAIEADVLISALQSAGLNPEDLRASGHVISGGADFSYAVRVPTSELREAREILTALESEGPLDRV